MNDEVEESLVDDLLKTYLEEERQHTSGQFEQQARATFQQLVEEASLLRADITYVDVRDGVQGLAPIHEVRLEEFQHITAKANEKARPSRLNRINFQEAIRLLRRLLAATADHPGVLASALGYRENKKDAEHRAMMRAVEYLHNDPLRSGGTGGRPPWGRGHRFKHDTDTCILCGARGSMKKGWRTDCTRNPPPRIRSKGTCAIAVAEAAQKAGITNTNGKRIDSAAVLRMYNRWQRDGSPREREHERLLRDTQK